MKGLVWTGSQAGVDCYLAMACVAPPVSDLGNRHPTQIRLSVVSVVFGCCRLAGLAGWQHFNGIVTIRTLRGVHSVLQEVSYGEITGRRLPPNYRNQTLALHTRLLGVCKSHN